MDSFDRVFSSLKNQFVDRPPVFPHIGDHAGLLQGLTYDIMYKDAKKAADAHIRTLDLYGYDFIEIQVEPSFSIVEACGAEVLYPKDKNPWIVKHFIQKEEDLEKLEIPDFMETLSTEVMIEGTQILADEGNAPVVAFMTGPLTFSFQLMSYKEIFLNIKRNPDFIHRLVSKSVSVIRAYVGMLKAAGAQVLVICEHDLQMVPPIIMKEFCLDYLPDILKIYDYNIFHLCGKVMPHLNFIAKDLQKLKQINILNIGPNLGINETQRLLNNKIGIAGNIDHKKLLPNGTPDQIENAVKYAIKDSEGDFRFMIAPGCEITSDTPVENVKAFVKAAQTYHR
ncbi:MAG: uroporphyrinogen decarboxylase family protein [Candidatus Lokiarchaeota archaeon]|jgi:uroporphyrinogen decarboxylase